MILWVFIKFFGVKIVITDIYRYFTDIYRYLSIFFQKFLHKRACSTVATRLSYVSSTIFNTSRLQHNSLILQSFSEGIYTWLG